MFIFRVISKCFLRHFKSWVLSISKWSVSKEMSRKDFGDKWMLVDNPSLTSVTNIDVAIEMAAVPASLGNSPRSYESYEKHLKNDFSIWSGRGMLFHLNTITRTTLIVSRATTTRVATRTNTCKILSTSIPWGKVLRKKLNFRRWEMHMRNWWRIMTIFYGIHFSACKIFQK